MSPEQASGQRELDGRCDQYALACVLYEMLAGQPPFTGPTIESILLRQLTVQAPRITDLQPDVPKAVAAALARALAKAPAERFSGMAAFVEAIEAPEAPAGAPPPAQLTSRSEEHTSELQSLAYLVCRLLLEKKKNINLIHHSHSRHVGRTIDTHL